MSLAEKTRDGQGNPAGVPLVSDGAALEAGKCSIKALRGFALYWPKYRRAMAEMAAAAATLAPVFNLSLPAPST